MGINMTLDNEFRELRAILANAKASAEMKQLAKAQIERILTFYGEKA